jgi:hypothetical protein
MHENAVLHFDLGHLGDDGPFTLHVGAQRYTLCRHTRQTLAEARRNNAALGLLPRVSPSHYAGPVRLPGQGVVLLRVSGPRLRQEEPLDRLVHTAIWVPRQHRLTALAQRRAVGRAPSLTKWAAVGRGSPVIADKVIVDLDDYQTAQEAAVSLIFHHPEMMALHSDPAALVLEDIREAAGLDNLSAAIYVQAVTHKSDPSQPNWVISKPGTDFRTGGEADPIYVWSAATVAAMAEPLQSALEITKNDLLLELQCWTVQRAITAVSRAPSAAGPIGAAEANYTVKELTPQSGVTNSFSYDRSSKQATITLTNSYLRWLQVSLDQYGPKGERVADTTTLGYLSPVDTIMAVPLPAQPSNFPFTFVAAASSATISMGGLGQTPISTTYDLRGLLLTVVFNYAIPTIFIALGVGVGQFEDEWEETVKETVSKVLMGAELLLEGPIGGAITGGLSLEDIITLIGNCAASLLTQVLTDAELLASFVAQVAGEEAAQDATPFIGWISAALGAASDVASMIETSVEVARSPATMALSVLRTMDLQVTVDPDPAHHGQWPATATTFTITVTYNAGPIYTLSGEMDPTTQHGPIVRTLTDLPAGGSLVVSTGFYSATGWLAGQGATSSIPAQPNQGSTLIATITITENLVPLTATTSYAFKEKLGYANGIRVWLPASSGAPTETVSDLNMSNVGNNLGALGELGLNEPLSALAYLWSASGQDLPLAGSGNKRFSGQEYTYQSISDGAAPESGLKFPGEGYIAPPCIALPPPTMAAPVADGFLLVLDASDTFMQLRALSLQPGQPILPAPDLSFGRFVSPVDDLAIHPAGYAVALSTATCKLQIVKLGTQLADSDAPAASIYSGRGTRAGLLSDPRAVSCSLDKILVLDSTPTYPQGCIAAFDFKGNPAYCFARNATVMPLRAESGGVIPVDLSVESKGYVYVLKYLPPASGPVLASDYRLDIYNPDGSFLTQVAGLAAARLQVDLWRNLFTLNYEIVQGSGRTEPSVSQWIPSTPGVATSPSQR